MPKRALMKLARSSFGGGLAWFALTKLRRLLPVKIYDENQTIVMIGHPMPMEQGHRLIVPRGRIKDIFELLEQSGEWRMLAAAIRKCIDPEKDCLCCNTGKRQEVKQMHIHVLDKEKRHYAADHPVKKGEGWLLEGHGRCIIDIKRFEDEEMLREALFNGRENYSDGMSVIWQ